MFVTSETSLEGKPSVLSAEAVPPVDKIEMECRCSVSARVARDFLSVTDTREVVIFTLDPISTFPVIIRYLGLKSTFTATTRANTNNRVHDHIGSSLR